MHSAAQRSADRLLVYRSCHQALSTARFRRAGSSATAVTRCRSMPTSYADHSEITNAIQQQQQQRQQTHQPASTAGNSYCTSGHPADLSVCVPPAWQGRSVAGPKLRLVNMAAFVDFTLPTTADLLNNNAVRLSHRHRIDGLS